VLSEGEGIGGRLSYTVHVYMGFCHK